MKKTNRAHKPNRPHNLRRQARPQRAAAPQRDAETPDKATSPVWLLLWRLVALYVRAGLRTSPSTTMTAVGRTPARAFAGPVSNSSMRAARCRSSAPTAK